MRGARERIDRVATLRERAARGELVSGWDCNCSRCRGDGPDDDEDERRRPEVDDDNAEDAWESRRRYGDGPRWDD